jgi:outer membrane lipoprotein carrier protein
VLAACLVAWAPASLATSQEAAQSPLSDITRRLQQKYDALRDFSARFVHVYEGGLLGRRVTERGTVLIKRPGRMRWTYTDPEPKEFVSDGLTLYAYVPQDRQVIVSRMPPADEASSPVLFLAGKGSLTRDFAIDYADLPDAPAGTYALKLVPKERQAEYDWLVLVVDRLTLGLRTLVTVDGQGGRSTFTFTDLKENGGLSDKQFVFKIPRGVDVVTDPGRIR